MSAMAYQIISLTIVYSTFYSGADQREYLLRPFAMTRKKRPSSTNVMLKIHKQRRHDK